MVRPRKLWALFMACDDSRWLGDICRALGGQEVELDAKQRRVLRTLAKPKGDRRRAKGVL